MFDRLQKLQNRAARVLTFSRYDADANRLCRQLNWKELSTQFQIQKALMVYKSLNDLAPGYLSSKFAKRFESRYSLRDSMNKIIVPFPRTNFMKNSFSYTLLAEAFPFVFLSVVLPFSSRIWLLAFCFGCFCAEEKTSADSRSGFLLSMRIRYLQDLGGNHMTKPVVEGRP